MKVKNHSCIRTISRKSMMAAHTRNGIAVLAIALTTILFTALFTIMMSINQSFQYSNFRQAGGYNHGNFKELTKEQYQELKTDSQIKEFGYRRFVGMPRNMPFHKSHVEVSFCDANTAHWMFCDPKEGRLPKEGTKEAATDRRVLSLLGVEPKIGEEFTVTFTVDGKETTQTFVLSGWWEYDEACTASHILIAESYAEAIFQELGTEGKDGMTGKWDMGIMLRSSLHIREELLEILERHGFQTEDSFAENYIKIGVNWGYVGAQLSSNVDLLTVVAMTVLILIIVFTGYLIIYNVFQISVTNDIRFYGLLKTIGTTGHQIRKILYGQAMLLSVVGIPIGLLSGYLIGISLIPFVMQKINSGIQAEASVSPIIFIGASLFSLFTVWISCMRPGKLAARVSPIEAVRYTEGAGSKKTVKNGGGKVSLPRMAWANLGRSRGKTIVTILSLTFAVVLLNIVVTFTNGFDMDKYLARMAADFILAEASYFQTNGFFYAGRALPEEDIAQVEAQGGITESGRIYGKVSNIMEFVTEEYYRKAKGKWNSKEILDLEIEQTQKDEEGRIMDNVSLYGMEHYPLSRLTVVEGDISKLDTSGNYIAAVYEADDYGKVMEDSNWAKLGDKISLYYVEEWEYFNPDTGEIYPDPDQITETEHYDMRMKTYRTVEYEVAAIVIVPSSLSYRYYGSDAFVLNADIFCRDTQTNAVLQYCFDTTKESNAAMEAFLIDYTEHQNSALDYESKQTYAEEFQGFQMMFSLLGGLMCLIIGIVGVLNFLNAMLTGMITRKREFAVLQSIGMTGRQLQSMLIWEGMYYAMGAVGLAGILCIVLVPLVSGVFQSAFWFFTYRFTILPIVCVAPVFGLLGVVTPLLMYRRIAKFSIVERLREIE